MSMFQHIMIWSVMAIIALLIPLPGTFPAFIMVVTPCYIALIIVATIISALFGRKKKDYGN